MKKKKLIGKGEESSDSFSLIFNKQRVFQKKITLLETPVDSVKWYIYHITAMQEELGEVLKSDKRWKTHRNEAYDPENKLEEIADIFITAMNLGMFSGFSSKDLMRKISSKIDENTKKLEAIK